MTVDPVIAQRVTKLMRAPPPPAPVPISAEARCVLAALPCFIGELRDRVPFQAQPARLRDILFETWRLGEAQPSGIFWRRKGESDDR